MSNRNEDTIVIEGVNVLGGRFRNFSGLPFGKMPAGRRTFCIELPDDVAKQMVAEGFTVKTLDPTDEYQKPLHFMQIKVRFDRRPPQVILLKGKSNRKVRLTEDSIDNLDSLQIEWADVEFSKYNWENATDHGTAAYLVYGCFKVSESKLAEKYADDDFGDYEE